MAIFSPNSVDIASVTFGSQWAGGVVCPFNNQFTTSELASQLRSSRSKAMATHVACLEVAKEAALLAGLSMDRIIIIGDDDPKGLVKHYSSLLYDSTAVTKAKIDPEEDIAFLVYSSGTTGLPKGVMLTHRNIIANVLQVTAMDLGEVDWRKDRYVGFLPMYHIYGRCGVCGIPLACAEFFQVWRCQFSLPYIEVLPCTSCKSSNWRDCAKSYKIARSQWSTLSRRLFYCLPNIQLLPNTT